MGKKLFRQNAEEEGISPDQLQDYVRVTNPLVWTVLIAVVLLLAGGFIAASFGKVELTMNDSATVSSGTAHIEVATPDANKLKEGMVVRFPEQKVEATIEVLEWLSDYLIQASFAIDLPDTSTSPYPCVIVIDRVSPIGFLMN